MIDPRDVFPDKLEERLTSSGLSAGELACTIGVRELDVERWLDGLDFPCPREFERVCGALNAVRDELLCP